MHVVQALICVEGHFVLNLTCMLHKSWFVFKVSFCEQSEIIFWWHKLLNINDFISMCQDWCHSKTVVCVRKQTEGTCCNCMTADERL
jgi:hypothetical protein